LGMVAIAGLILITVILCAVALGWLPCKGVWPIYAAIALTGVVRAFLSPIYDALLARVLQRSHFAHGAGLGSVVFQAGMVIGPALGGALVGWGSKRLAYAVAAVMAAIALAALARLKVEEPPPPATRAP